MARIELRLPPDLVDALVSECPRTLTLPKFCAQLIEAQLTRVRTLPAYRVGAGNPSHLITETSLRLEEAPQGAEAVLSLPPLKKNFSKVRAHLEDGVGKGLVGETPRKEPLTPDGGYKSSEPVLIPEAQLGRTRQANTKGSPAFEAFWKQYQAIKRRASNQSKPKALAMWEQVLDTGITAEQLSKALGAAVTKQNQAERDGGHPSPFPDCFRWLRDGYYEAFLEAAAALPAPLARPDLTPPPEFADCPF